MTDLCVCVRAPIYSDFPKALWACTAAEIVTFSIVGAVIYVYTGDQYMVTPAFGVLTDTYKKISYSFMVPTIIFVGCLYASVTGRFVFFRMFKDSKHVSEHTFKGWVSWGLVLLASWTLSFIIAEVIPFFSSCEFSSWGSSLPPSSLALPILILFPLPCK